MEVIDQPCVAIAGVALTDPGPASADPVRLCVLGSTPTEAQAVFEVAWADPTPGPGARPTTGRLSFGGEVPVDPAGVSAASAFTADGPAGPVPGLFYAPTNRRVGAPSTDGPDPGLPPLVVFCHGGPTSAAEGGFDPLVQFFTSRGLAVAAVNYRGSSGYGRSYRRQLDGLWGEADIDDCVAFADALAGAGLVDGGRMAIRGTSAGGLTALGALIRSRSFAGAASWYGVTDLAALATDTHDFESRYLDSLVGPWPEAADRYRARSPLYHPERVSGSVLLLQGADDPVVPADQSERFAAQLAEHGVSCRLVVFAGESHGFRRADTIEACLDAELDFYRSLFDPAGPGEPPVDRD
jgi:dipeptidyl aminopeptidase/acylaminoacyl peptidase